MQMKLIIDLIFNFSFYVSRILTFCQYHSQHYRFGIGIRLERYLVGIQIKFQYKIKQGNILL